MATDKETCISKVCGLIEDALAFTRCENEEAAVDLLDAYIDKFAAIESDLNKISETGADSAMASDLRKLFESHKSVLAHAETLKIGVQRQIRELKKKGRGIIAYTDNLPKRVGLIRPRKM